jgi:predicted dehydrogenase
MKILIVGLGSIGRRHLKNLLMLGERDIIFYRTQKSTLPNDDLSDFPVFYDLDQAVAQKPDAVIISNPTAFHMPVAEIAADNNIHIFLEKPASHTVDSVQRFEKILESSTSKILIAYQFRFNSGLRKLKELVESKELGSVLSFSCEWGEYLPEWHPWEDYRQSYAAQAKMGGGVVLTLSHPIDYLRWMFGEVRELFAVTGNASRLGIDVEDFADVNFKFRNGITGMMHLDYYRRPKKHDLTVVCENGTLHWDYKNSIVTVEKASGEIETIAPPGKNERNQMYLQEMSHFLDVCEGDSNSFCSYQDGKNALIIAHGILMSGRHQERVIFEE